MRTILKKALQGEGFVSISEAGNGQEALEQLKAIGAVELVLLDWNMPVMSGIEFLKAMRAQTEYTDVRVMMVTTETEPQQVLRALNAGADEYIMKPFTRDVLQTKLQLLGFAR